MSIEAFNTTAVRTELGSFDCGTPFFPEEWQFNSDQHDRNKMRKVDDDDLHCDQVSTRIMPDAVLTNDTTVPTDDTLIQRLGSPIFEIRLRSTQDLTARVAEELRSGDSPAFRAVLQAYGAPCDLETQRRIESVIDAAGQAGFRSIISARGSDNRQLAVGGASAFRRIDTNSLLDAVADDRSMLLSVREALASRPSAAAELNSYCHREELPSTAEQFRRTIAAAEISQAPATIFSLSLAYGMQLVEQGEQGRGLAYLFRSLQGLQEMSATPDRFISGPLHAIEFAQRIQAYLESDRARNLPFVIPWIMHVQAEMARQLGTRFRDANRSESE